MYVLFAISHFHFHGPGTQITILFLVSFIEKFFFFGFSFFGSRYSYIHNIFLDRSDLKISSLATTRFVNCEMGVLQQYTLAAPSGTEHRVFFFSDLVTSYRLRYFYRSDLKISEYSYTTSFVNYEWAPILTIYADNTILG